MSAVNWIFWNYSNLVISTRMQAVVFLKILKGKKWDQIKRRDVELVDKKTQVKQCDVFICKAWVSQQKSGIALSWASACITEKTSFHSCRTFATLFEMCTNFIIMMDIFKRAPLNSGFFFHVHIIDVTVNTFTSTTQFEVDRLYVLQ